MMNKYVFRVFIVLLAVTVAAAGCGGPSQPTPVQRDSSATSAAQSSVLTATDETPVDGDWIIHRLAVEPKHFNILLDTADAYSNRMTMATFETLLDYDRLTMELEPVLAESYEIAADHLTYTFKMRRNATFSDGVPVTAHDIKFTFNAIRDPKNETADLRNYYQDVVACELLDDYTIRFVCDKPYFRHLIMLGAGLPAFPRHIYGEGDFNTHPNNRYPTGSGPYVFESWETNQQVVFTRNDNYWNKEEMPYVRKIVYKIITDDNAAFQVLQRQELDVMALSPEQWEHPARSPEFEAKFDKYTYWARTGYIGGYNYISWNMRRPLFKDKRVRRAMTMLLDRDLILETIFYGLGQVVSGAAISQSREYDKNIKPWPFDHEEAKRLLDEAGWVDTDGDGIRDKDGMAFRFEFLLPANSPEAQQMITVFKEELERAGIEMTIRQLEWATFIENLVNRSFDAVTLAWAIPPDSDPYQVWHSSQAEKGSNSPGFKNDEVDRLLENIRVEFDREKRIPMFHRFHAILHDEQPYTFLFNLKSRAAIGKRFRNVNIYALGLYEREWWVPLRLQRYK